MTSLTLSKVPRYQELVESISDQIRSGELLPGSRLPSFTEMREQQGISQTTIVKVYSHLEQEGLIRREPKRGVFVAPQERARTGQIGFIGSAFSQRKQLPYAAHTVEGIEAVARRENLRIVLLPYDRPMEPGVVDGVLLESIHPRIEEFLPAGLPAVTLIDSVEGLPSVVADDFNGARLGMRRLVALGHRRIAALLQKSALSVHMRAAGYRAGLEEANIPFEEAWLHDSKLAMTPAGYRTWGYESMRQWLAGDWHSLRCTALFVQNDMAALGVLDALREAEIRVPSDLSVLSFDGTEVCEYCWPSLAAVEVPLEKIAIAGMELLLRMIGGEKVEPAITMLPPTWKEGGSIAPLS